MRCAEIDTAAAPTPDPGKQPPVVIVEDRIGITASVTVRLRIVVVVAPWHALTADLPTRRETSLSSDVARLGFRANWGS